MLSWNSADNVVEDVSLQDMPEKPTPPTPALYYQGGIVPQPLPDMLSLGLALQQQVGGVARSTGTDEEIVPDDAMPKGASGESRFLYGRVLLGLGSLLVAGGMALLINANSKRVNAAQERRR